MPSWKEFHLVTLMLGLTKFKLLWINLNVANTCDDLQVLIKLGYGLNLLEKQC